MLLFFNSALWAAAALRSNFLGCFLTIFNDNLLHIWHLGLKCACCCVTLVELNPQTFIYLVWFFDCELWQNQSGGQDLTRTCQSLSVRLNSDCNWVQLQTNNWLSCSSFYVSDKPKLLIISKWAEWRSVNSASLTDTCLKYYLYLYLYLAEAT